ncbi:hypothetical protein N665_0098s0058 [Sinapis alba]|nr:hypothetical protein N665_0098s0058 [Sinapis alba]
MDVSEAQSQDYPRRLYPKESSNLEGKDINHNFHIGEFHHRSHIGVIAKLEGLKSVCLIVDQPIRFSLHEFGEITGLNTDPVPTKSFEPDQYKAFWEELNIPLGMGSKLDELKAALEVCPPWSFEKHKWLGLLLLQAMGLYALHHNYRIPFESTKRVFDDEDMMFYPWGRIEYEVLVDSIKMLDLQGRSYTINGMKDVLLVWAYESVSPQLVNLITDIHADIFVRGFWEVEGNEKKKKVKGGVSSEAEPPTKKQKKVKKQIVSLTSEEEGIGEMVNNAFLVNIMSTLENISRKFDHHESRFEMIELMLNANDSKRDMPNMDQHTIDDIVKATMAEHLKDFISGAAIPDKADKADALSFLYISPAKADKDAKASKAAKDAKAQKDGKDEAGSSLHVAAYMKVLIGRFMRDPTPFWSKHTAFIDHWFITLWVHDYKQFKINPNLMKFKGVGYEDLIPIYPLGLTPPYFKTNLKWFEAITG